MSFYWISAVRDFFPLAFLIGIASALWPLAERERCLRLLWQGLGWSIAASLIAFSAIDEPGSVRTLRLALEGLGIFSVLTLITACGKASAESANHFGASVFRVAFPVAVFSLTGGALLAYLVTLSTRGLSASGVLNSELILNLAGISAGILLSLGSGICTAHAVSRQSLSWRKLLLVVSVFPLVVDTLARGSIEMMRLQYLEASSERLSTVAKTLHAVQFFEYLYAALFAGILLVYFFSRPRVNAAEKENLTTPEWRKALSLQRSARRWLGALAGMAVLVLGTLLYDDLYASRPVSISTPTKITAGEDGLIRIATDTVADGNLHRFSYVSKAGHAVRFFLINRHPGSVNLGVVLDACRQCPPDGYVKKGNHVMCLACQSRIFVPSIGAVGGCNPIPLKSEVVDEEIVIGVEQLEALASIFPVEAALDGHGKNKHHGSGS